MKKNLLWLSDIHQDIIGHPLKGAYETFARQRPMGVLVTGDISQAPELDKDLGVLASAFSCSVFVTRGNHDYFGDGIESVQRQMRETCVQHNNLVYLDQAGPVWLNKTTVLIGCQGWGDGRAGAGKKSNLVINDRAFISDFIGKKKGAYFRALHDLGRASAANFLQAFASVADRAEHIILATHVPPFVPSLVRRPDHADFAPFYVNMALGRTLLRVARRYPRTKFSVYSGHTHQATTYSPLNNLSAYVAGADYYNFQGPRIDLRNRISKAHGARHSMATDTLSTSIS